MRRNLTAGVAAPPDKTDWHAVAQARLAAAVRTIAPRHASELDEQKKTTVWEQSDFVWEALLLSMGTMGNSRGAALVRKERFHRRVSWRALSRLKQTERLARLDEILRAAGVRMPGKKAIWLDANFERIEAAGGPLAVKVALQECRGREAKIRFLREFDGIGEKYARNVLMDAYHPDFRDSIAVDERINKISDALGLKFRSYEEAEEFYLGVARTAGLEGWELDRLMYGFTAEFLSLIADGHDTGLSACPFCSFSPDQVLLSCATGVALADAYPVVDGHTLVIPRRHVGGFYQLTRHEQRDLWRLVFDVRDHLIASAQTECFNIGINDGEAAGHTIGHAHIDTAPAR